MVFQQGNADGLLTRFQKQEGSIVKGTCLNCGEAFSSYRSNKQKHCSAECAYKSLSARTGALHHNYARATTICAVCETPFEHLPSKPRKFCSRKCAAQTVPQRVGERNPNWKGGITPIIKAIRTSKDYALWRRAVFERDEYRCQNCSVRSNLHAHHLERVADNVARVFDITNGITLCIDCHQQEHPELRLTMRKEVA